MAILTNPTLALIPAVRLACLVWRRGPAFRAGLGYVAALGAVCFLTLLPWAIRNQMQLGAWIFTRGNLGLELLDSHGPGAGVTMLENYSRAPEEVQHPSDDPAICERVAREGEVAFNRWAKEEALSHIRARPATFARLTALRAWRYLFPYVPWPPAEAGAAAISLCVLGGLALLWRRGFALQALLLASLFVLSTAFYSLFQASGRYRYVVEWVILLPAGYAVVWALARRVELERASREGC